MQHHPTYQCGGEDLDSYSELFAGHHVSEAYFDRTAATHGTRIIAEVRFDNEDIADGVDRFVLINDTVFCVCDDIEDGMIQLSDHSRKVLHELEMFFTDNISLTD